MRLKILLSVSSLIFFFLLFPDNLLADYEYITYGGYFAAVEAWRKVALIFGDSNFKGLLLVAVVLGTLILFYKVLIGAALGTRADLLRGWLVPVGAGLVFGVVFILPKDSIVIYDEVLNRGPEEIRNIPKVLAITAHLLNKVERGFIEIVDTSVIDPNAKYSYNAGGLSSNLLKNLSILWNAGSDVTSMIQAQRSYLVDSLQSYMKDCILPEIAINNGNTVNFAKLFSGTMGIREAIEISRNDNFFTAYYRKDGSKVEGASCTEAGNTILSYLDEEMQLTSGTIAYELVKTACDIAGYGGEIINCREKIESELVKMSDKLGIVNPGLELAIYQGFAGSIIYHFLLSQNMNEALRVLATSQTMSSFWGLGEHANSWVPVVKEALTSLAIALSPFILLFAVTPLVGRALSLQVGFLLWLVIWGVIDAVIFTFGRELAFSYVPRLANLTMNSNLATNFGIAVAMTMPSYTGKVVAIFGMMRWMGMGLATVFTALLIRFGGTVLALLASQIASAPMGAGASYGATLVRNPSSVFTGEVMPTQAMSGAAIAMGGIGGWYGGTLRMTTGEAIARAKTGSIYTPQQIAQAQATSSVIETEKRLALGGIGSGIKLGTFLGAGERATLEAYEDVYGSPGRLGQAFREEKVSQESYRLQKFVPLLSEVKGWLSTKESTFRYVLGAGLLSFRPDGESVVLKGMGGSQIQYSRDMEPVLVFVPPNSPIRAGLQNKLTEALSEQLANTYGKDQSFVFNTVAALSRGREFSQVREKLYSITKELANNIQRQTGLSDELSFAVAAKILDQYRQKLGANIGVNFGELVGGALEKKLKGIDLGVSADYSKIYIKEGGKTSGLTYKLDISEVHNILDRFSQVSGEVFRTAVRDTRAINYLKEYAERDTGTFGKAFKEFLESRESVEKFVSADLTPQVLQKVFINEYREQLKSTGGDALEAGLRAEQALYEYIANFEVHKDKFMRVLRESGLLEEETLKEPGALKERIENEGKLVKQVIETQRDTVESKTGKVPQDEKDLYIPGSAPSPSPRYKTPGPPAGEKEIAEHKQLRKSVMEQLNDPNLMQRLQQNPNAVPILKDLFSLDSDKSVKERLNQPETANLLKELGIKALPKSELSESKQGESKPNPGGPKGPTSLFDTFKKAMSSR